MINANFEEWDNLGARAFDIVFAATSWHWINPGLRYQKAAKFTAGTHAFPRDVDPFFLEIQSAYSAIGMPWPGDWPPPLPEEMPDARAAIEASGLFEDVRFARYLWTDKYNSDSHVELMRTASDHHCPSMGRERTFRLFAR